MNFFKKYFTYNGEYISGGKYLLRLFVASFLLVLFVFPGVYFAAISAYKRSKSLKWSVEMVWISTIAIAILPIINFVPEEVAGEILYISFPISLIHLFLLFSNGNPDLKKYNNKVVDDKLYNQSKLPTFQDAVTISKNDDIFNQNVKSLFDQFELDLNKQNFEDYPMPFWYDIVKSRSEGMKVSSSFRSMNEIQNEWTWMHCDEYLKKYKSVNNKEKIKAISLRIERFGYIYKLLCDLDFNINNLSKLNIKNNPLLESVKWHKISAASSLFGSIKFALSIGINHSEIKNLYSDYKYDELLINGTDPFKSMGSTKEEVVKKIKDETGIDINKEMFKQVEIKKRVSSSLSHLELEKRYAIFTILLQIANLDGLTSDENKLLADVLIELDIDAKKYNDAQMDGNQACDLLQNLDMTQKEELSRYIVMIVGADKDFSSNEMLWVNDIIRELKLDSSIILKLSNKFWNKKHNEPLADTVAAKPVVKDQANSSSSNKIIEKTYEEITNMDEKILFIVENEPFTGTLTSNKTEKQGKIECQYVNGKRHGEYIQFDNEDDNKISHTKFYKEGKLHGPDTFWYEKYVDGYNVKKDDFSKNLKLDGELKEMMDKMLKKHDIMRQINYKDGVYHGKWYECNWNGGIIYEINFKDGKKHGVWNQYFETSLGTGQGPLKKVSVYNNDSHISSIYYNRDHEEIQQKDALQDKSWGNELWEMNHKF